MPIAMLSTSLLTNPQKYGRFNALDTPQPTKPGMVLMKATSIDYSGTSATLGENGQVTFSAVTSLSLNGVFTADFDNYVISCRHSISATDVGIFGRLRASGVDASGSDYTYQFLLADGSSALSGRTTGSDFTFPFVTSSTQRSGDTVFIYGPALAQPTAMRSINIWGKSSATIDDVASTHSLSTAYDGITIYVNPVNPDTISGAIQVYGVRS